MHVLDQTDRPRKRVIVVGGGVAGLAAAYRIVERSQADGVAVEVVVLEAEARPGGSILTTQQGDFLIEAGPDSFITQKPWALQLCQRLGIDDQIIGTNPDRRRVYVVRRGKLYPVPEGFLLLAPTRIWPFAFSRLFSWPGKLRMGLDVVLPAKRRGPDEDETLADFVRRRFGRQALERIAQPLVGGIYASDPEKLSLRATMPRFLDLEDKYRSLILGMRKARQQMGRGKGESGARYSMFVSFERGMTTLTDALVRELPGGSVHTGTAATSLAREGAGWRVSCADGNSIAGDAVILACPAYASAKLIEGLDSGLAGELAGLDYSSTATMTLGFRREQIDHPLDGFGFVVPATEKRTMMAGTFGSVKFAHRAPSGHVLMRVFLGGAMQPDILDHDDAELRGRVLDELGQLIGVRGEPLFVETWRWPRSMPQYPLGHLDWIARIHERLANHAGLTVAGSAFGGVGVPDCVHTGQVAADRIMDGWTGSKQES